MASFDLRRILAGWPYQAGQITVRKVRGDDGVDKIQMRLDLGLLQMEMSGRPDGQRPHGAESLLHYHQKRRDDYITRNGTDVGFLLSGEDCQALRDEALMYYHRYLSLFVLEDFDGVERDTARNLEVLDFCRRHGVDDEERTALEPYRCYLIMMNTRAKAHRAIRRGSYKTALAYVDTGLRSMKEYLVSTGQEELYDQASEVAILKALRDEITEHLPSDPLLALEEQLASALREERYEEAAEIRDRLAKLRARKVPRRPRRRGNSA